MAKRTQTVRQLADEVQRDYEEVLLALWEAGLRYLEDVDAIVPQRDLARARQVLDIPSPAELRSAAYWQASLGMDETAFRHYLKSLGIEMSHRARRLPKGAIRRLRRAQNRDPVALVAQARVQAAQSPESRDGDSRDTTTKPPLLEWQRVGKQRDVHHLTPDEVLGVHEALVGDFAGSLDPISPPGVRSQALLESAVQRPRTSLGAEEKYPSVEMAAAALLHAVIHNHPFYNGNKRTALVATLCMLDRNNMVLTASESELFMFVLRVAQHGFVDPSWGQLADREVMEIAQWIRGNSRRIEKGENPIKWHELRRILLGFECAFEHPSGVGNRVNISRHVEHRALLGRRRMRTLRKQTNYADEGREVERSQLNQIRRDLELDEGHGVDSAAFYRGEREIDEFIAMYRKTLQRLARV